MANKLPSQLAVYFNDIPRDILNEMTNEELMHIVDKEDRVWMMLFLKNGGFKTMADDSDVMNEATGQILRLTSSVVSDRFKQYDPNSCLSNILQLRLGSEASKKQLAVLDLRDNNLLDQDLLTLEGFLTSCELPNFRYLLLAFNRFDPTPEAGQAVLKLLRHFPALTVLLAGNPLATISGCSVLFNDLTIDEACRLIFALESHIVAFRSQSWRVLFQENHKISADQLDRVQQAHADFYVSSMGFWRRRVLKQ
eukprot:TRINITY_DN9421_c0_g1_i1.p1 TRINITY_DN9421_c0_g1~~TRINITY_DN9421_c0_g1_i1.p1  ORF type:complete len:252 (+),score=34.11 TRINITY_DN9421_c0_g1_i1:148-903(+)